MRHAAEQHDWRGRLLSRVLGLLDGSVELSPLATFAHKIKLDDG